jgi:hypothetical protein
MRCVKCGWVTPRIKTVEDDFYSIHLKKMAEIQEAELDHLRAENKRLRDALRPCVAWIDRHHPMSCYSEMLCNARAAISSVDQAEPEIEPDICAWTYYPSGVWGTACGNGIVGIEPMTKCTFCGKRVEVRR